MHLEPGTRIGHCEVGEPLGKGGMGEVYRARDTALGRDVALKVLPDAFAADSDRLARFEREAQALASLNHPNIAQVYAIERIDTGGRAIVMELVEGEDLSERISRGAIPMDEALSLARQIALALEAAHEAGIIHRDLKPANIKVRGDGTAKVLDFGLAKARGGDPASAGSLANSPTLTERATELGLVLGTAAYMAPEQAKGRVVDRRADVWAFGVVLYEMLTGRRAFSGDDVTEVMAAVIRDTPDPKALPAGTPMAVRRLLRRCLEKDVRKRLRDMGDVGVELDEAIAMPAADETNRTSDGTTTLAATHRSPLVLAGAAVVLIGLAGGAAWTLKPAPVVDRPVTRFTVLLDHGQQLQNPNNNPNLAWSRDGRRLAYRADGVVYIRSFDEDRPREVVKAPGAGQWFSPDGNELLYRTTSGFSKVPVGGGPSQPVMALEGLAGLDWADDGTIVYSDGKSIRRTAASGGASTVLLTAPEGGHVSAPRVLPGARALLYTLTEGTAPAVVASAIDGAARDVRRLLPGVIAARYVPSGHLLYGLDNRLMAVPFDADRLEVTGPAVPMPEPVQVSVAGLPQIAVSHSGSLAYAAREQAQALQLSWVEPQGQSRAVVTVPRNYSDVTLSPDGRRAALHLWDEDNDVWVADLVRGGLTRITFTKEEEETPFWSPDGRELAYAAAREGRRRLFIRPADGSAAAVERQVWEDADHFHVNAWSPDAQTIIVEVRRASTGTDILAVDVKTGTATNLLASPYAEYNARLSPDGKWLAYVSEESGRAEVYVQPYPALNARVPVSTGGGREPVWARDGRKLFFRSDESVMEAATTSVSPLEFAAPKVLFGDTFTRTQGNGHTHFDVAPDGRFLMIDSPNKGKVGPQEIHIVLNWADQLQRLAPTKK